MQPAHRLHRAVARLMTAGVVVGSLFGVASTASAQVVCNPCTPVLQIVQPPDLTVAVTASPSVVAKNGVLAYGLTVSSTAMNYFRGFIARPYPSYTVSGVRVHIKNNNSTEFMTSFHDDTGTGFVCYTPAEYFGMDTRCVSGTLAPNTSAHITINMKASSVAGSFTTNATVDPYSEIAEANESNNGASVAFSVN